MHRRFKLYFVSEILHCRGENKDGLRNSAESVHAAQTYSGGDQNKNEKINKKKKNTNTGITSIDKNHLRTFPK